MNKTLLAIFAFLFSLSATAGSKPVTLTYDFTSMNTHGWTPVFRDIPADIHAEYQRRVSSGESLGPVGYNVDLNNVSKYPEEQATWLMNAGLYSLPPSIKASGRTGYLLQVFNHSDDADMWLVKKVGAAQGIKPKTKYTMKMKVQFASNAPEGCMGVGGSPAALYLHMGATPKDPNAAKLSSSSSNIVFAPGILKESFRSPYDISNGIPCPEDLTKVPYKLVTRDHKVSSVESDAKGNLWLMVGTHSGFEAFSALYYTKVQVELTPK